MSIRKTTQPSDISDSRRRFLNNIDWLHWATVLAVYSITGTLAAVLSRLVLNGALNMEGGFASGPWAYRGVYVLVMPPLYSLMLIAVGTIFGKHLYFRGRVLKMWGRLLPLKGISKICTVIQSMFRT